MLLQTTIANSISCYGIGVHSGKKTQVTLKSAPKDTGVIFIRTDVHLVDNKIQASYKNVFDTNLSTSIKNIAGTKVSTIEHLMAAIWGCNISNIIVEIDGPEVPIMDGSSQPFVFMIECAGIKKLTTPRKHLKLLKNIKIIDNGCEIIATPADDLHIDLAIDFNSLAIGKQQFSFSKNSNFIKDIADSRTFGFVHELDYLQSKGLAKGASLDNAIGIDGDVILNHNGLRHEDEFVRHKLLDLAGDLFSSGGGFIGKINGLKTSHSLNNQFLHKIFNDPYSYQWVEKPNF